MILARETPWTVRLAQTKGTYARPTRAAREVFNGMHGADDAIATHKRTRSRNAEKFTARLCRNSITREFQRLSGARGLALRGDILMEMSPELTPRPIRGTRRRKKNIYARYKTARALLSPRCPSLTPFIAGPAEPQQVSVPGSINAPVQCFPSSLRYVDSAHPDTYLNLRRSGRVSTTIG